MTPVTRALGGGPCLRLAGEQSPAHPSPSPWPLGWHHGSDGGHVGLLGEQQGHKTQIPEADAPWQCTTGPSWGRGPSTRKEAGKPQPAWPLRGLGRELPGPRGAKLGVRGQPHRPRLSHHSSPSSSQANAGHAQGPAVVGVACRTPGRRHPGPLMPIMPPGKEASTSGPCGDHSRKGPCPEPGTWGNRAGTLDPHTLDPHTGGRPLRGQGEGPAVGSH